MDIKMPIKFHGSYQLIIRRGDSKSRERCQKLTVRELSTEEKGLHAGESDGCVLPTHLITFYDFGCKRIVEGRLKENEEDHVVFVVQDKEYTFSLLRPPSR